jgi:hypothetical protein
MQYAQDAGMPRFVFMGGSDNDFMVLRMLQRMMVMRAIMPGQLVQRTRNLGHE